MSTGIAEKFIYSLVIVAALGLGFGFWILSDHETRLAKSDAVASPEAELAKNRAVKISSNSATALPDDISDLFIEAVPVSSTMQPDAPEPAAKTATQGALSVSLDVSDQEWFAAIMQNANNTHDRVIAINITGVAAHTNLNANDHAPEELAEDTTEATIAANKIECPSVMYMGGSEYGRNMLVKMGCTPP